LTAEAPAATGPDRTARIRLWLAHITMRELTTLTYDVNLDVPQRLIARVMREVMPAGGVTARIAAPGGEPMALSTG